MSTAIDAPTILTLAEAADWLKVSTRTLYSLTRPRGPIPCIRVGSRGVRYRLAMLQEWIEKQENGEDCPENRSSQNGHSENIGG